MTLVNQWISFPNTLAPRFIMQKRSTIAYSLIESMVMRDMVSKLLIKKKQSKANQSSM